MRMACYNAPNKIQNGLAKTQRRCGVREEQKNVRAYDDDDL